MLTISDVDRGGQYFNNIAKIVILKNTIIDIVNLFAIILSIYRGGDNIVIIVIIVTTFLLDIPVSGNCYELPGLITLGLTAENSYATRVYIIVIISIIVIICLVIIVTLKSQYRPTLDVDGSYKHRLE